MLQSILFYLIILVSNIIQGITGFAGTILAMSPSLLLVGYPVCKPILNVLGILAGLMIMLRGRESVCKGELFRIIPTMMIGIVIGSLCKPYLEADQKRLYLVFGIFVLFLAAKGLWNSLGIAGRFRRNDAGPENGKAVEQDSGEKRGLFGLIRGYAILLSAGLIHGLFVSGGPLLIEYVSSKKLDRQQFRTTVSAVWVVLNTIILVDDIRSGYWNLELFPIFLGCLPFFWIAIRLGEMLCKRMSQRLFLLLTYALMAFSGMMLLLK